MFKIFYFNLYDIKDVFLNEYLYVYFYYNNNFLKKKKINKTNIFNFSYNNKNLLKIFYFKYFFYIMPI